MFINGGSTSVSETDQELLDELEMLEKNEEPEEQVNIQNFDPEMEALEQRLNNLQIPTNEIIIEKPVKQDEEE